MCNGEESNVQDHGQVLFLYRRRVSTFTRSAVFICASNQHGYVTALHVCYLKLYQLLHTLKEIIINVSFQISSLISEDITDELLFAYNNS